MTSRIRMPRVLEDLWGELSKKGPGPLYLRVDDLHPLDLYAGLDADGARMLVLLTDEEPLALAKRFQAFEVTSHQRGDGRWGLSVRLRRSEFGGVFAHLCQDLVDASRGGCSRAEAPRFVLDRIARWERLLSRDRLGLLDESSLRGLIGELIFMECCAIPARGASATIEAWRGPLEAEQDFHFADRLVEVKTASGGSLKAIISSAEQLEAHDSALFLVVISLEGVGESGAGSFTLPELVSRLRESVASSEDTLSRFEERLGLAGYAPHVEYDARRFVVRGTHHYVVEQGFPRLRRSGLPDGIGNVRYELDLSRCREFERESCFL
jgi:hypothetical protein